MRTLLSAAIMALPLSLATITVAQNPRQERVAIAKARLSAKGKGQLKGDAMVDSLVGAGAGQTMAVERSSA